MIELTAQARGELIVGWTGKEEEDMSDWRKEFAAEFKVPEPVQFVASWPGCADHSWHNDTCPSFGWEDDEGNGCWLKLWSDHPDAEARELQVDRFSVIEQDERWECNVLYEGDDVDAAISVLRTELTKKGIIDG